jgi:TolB-like protein/Tfp pilus assembly protein PilF
LLKTGVLGSGGSAQLKSVVVLPLVNRSGDTLQEYFADGMTEALITELGTISALTVISVTSAMTYKGSPKPLPEIARELGVANVVEGSVLREGGRVRITARLIDARTDRQVWDSVYEREAAGVLTLYSEAAQSIARTIGATLRPEEARRLRVSRTVDTAAYDEYLIGKHHASLLTAAGFTQAVEHYRRAIALDSTYVGAYAGLVDAYWWLTCVWGARPPRESVPLMRSSAERAVALDPGSAQAHLALAQVRTSFDWRWDEADREYRRALELNPSLADAHGLYGWFLTLVGRHDEAVRHAASMVALDPRESRSHLQLGWVSFYARRYQESIAALASALALDSTSAFARMETGWNYSVLGRHVEAIAVIDRALSDDPGNQVILASAVIIYARAGRTAPARRMLDSLLALGRTVSVDAYNVGQAYAFLGETDLALEYFGRAVEEPSVQVGSLKSEWLPEAFKADRRYHALLRRIRLE